MSEKYTPDMKEIKRDYIARRVREREGTDSYGVLEENAESEWHRFKAKIKADAVREAAGLPHGVDLTPTILGNPDPTWWYGYIQRLDESWRANLREQADKIEEDAG